MRDYLEPIFGSTGALIAQFAITLAVLAIIILVVFWLIRTLTGGSMGGTAIRGRQPRLSILDALPVDQKRRLVLVRRDNVEHLILIGGATDIVVEGAIHRPSAAQRRAEAAARSGAAPAPRAVPPAEPAYAADTRTHAESQPARAEAIEPPQAEAVVAEIVEVAAVVEEPPAYRAAPVDRRRPPMREPRPVAPPVEPAPAVEAERAPEPEPVFEPETIAARETAAEHATPSRQEAEEAPAAEPVVAEPEPAPPVRTPPPPRPSRPLTSFLTGSRGRASTPEPASSEVRPEPRVQEPRVQEPRAAEPVSRGFGRATPVAPRPPVAEERAEPAAPEPQAEPVRAPQRPLFPPAPPVVPPTLGDEPFGAPVADADRPLRFEPIFDIDPNNASDPGRPVRPAREPAPSVEPPLMAPEQAAEGEDEAPQRGRAAGVDDLEKEMARLLGEISGTRRT